MDEQANNPLYLIADPAGNKQLMDRIQLLITVEPGEEPVAKMIPIYSLLIVYRAIKNLGLQATSHIAALGLQIKGTKASKEDFEHIQETLDEIQSVTIKLLEAHPDIVEKASYVGLTLGHMSRREVAEFASELLGRPISSDAWRVHIDRWVKQHPVLEKIDMYGRRRTKDTSQR